MPGGKAIRPRDAQRYAAESRWSTALRKRFDGDVSRYARAIDMITDQVAEAATDAECQRRGAGLPFILDQLAQSERSEILQGAKMSVV